jgi:hypothetical protein
MGNLLVAVLPFALGAAVSPTLLALQLLVLSGTTHRLARAWSLAAGAGLVLAGFSILCVTALSRVHPSHAHKSATDATVLIAPGVLLGALAVRSRFRTPTVGERHTSRIGERLTTAPSSWFLGVGAVGMVVNFSTLLLVLPAVHEITHSTAATSAKVTAFVVLYLIALLPVLVPVMLAQVLGSRVDHALDATHRWVGRNSRTIGTVIEAVFAVYLVVKGVRAIP